MAKLIKVHGRSSLRGTVTFKDAKTNQLVDLSAKMLVFEIAGAKFRKNLLPSATGNVHERILYLTVAEIDALPITATPFIIRDETMAGGESIMDGGSIQRVGWKVAA